MSLRRIHLALVLVLSLAAAPSIAKPHACGKPTCTKEGTCEVCKIPLCEKRPGPGGKMVDGIVGTKTERTCTEEEAQTPARGGTPTVGSNTGPATLVKRSGPRILELPSGVTVEVSGTTARMSNGGTFTCGCFDSGCPSSCVATRKGDQITCSGTCQEPQEFRGCVISANCGWTKGSAASAPRPSGAAGMKAR